MKILSIDKYSLLNAVSALTVLIIIFFFTMNQIAYGAGSPNRFRSSDELREKANKYFKEGERLQEMKKYKQAARKYSQAVDIDSDYAEAWSNLGYSYRKQGKFDWAVYAYKKAIKLKSDLAEAHEYLGEAYAEMGKFGKAEKELQILRNAGRMKPMSWKNSSKK